MATDSHCYVYKFDTNSSWFDNQDDAYVRSKEKLASGLSGLVNRANNGSNITLLDHWDDFSWTYCLVDGERMDSFDYRDMVEKLKSQKKRWQFWKEDPVIPEAKYRREFKAVAAVVETDESALAALTERMAGEYEVKEGFPKRIDSLQIRFEDNLGSIEKHSYEQAQVYRQELLEYLQGQFPNLESDVIRSTPDVEEDSAGICVMGGWRELNYCYVGILRGPIREVLKAKQQVLQEKGFHNFRGYIYMWLPQDLL